MAITEYTSYAEVRAALGVDDEELEDATIALPMYEAHLEADLGDIDETLVSVFATVSALAEEDRTAEQKRFISITRLYATYAVAKHLTNALPMFGPKDITDGKAGVSRFSDSPYKSVLTSVKAEYDRLRGRLEAVFAALNSSTSTTVRSGYMSVVGLATDPVTGS